MQGTQHLSKIMRVALSALALCSLVFAYGTSLLADPAKHRSMIGLTDAGLGLLISSFFIGAVLVIVYGVPLFSFLMSRGIARWPYVLLVGAAPGISLSLFLGRQLGWPVIAFGVIVAASVRFFLGTGQGNRTGPDSQHQDRAEIP